MIFSYLLNMQSHPSWVCGLKQNSNDPDFANQGHTLRGCVDSNSCILCPPFLRFVTPFVGVWIETLECLTSFHKGRSHPSWVCGLKLIKINIYG